MLEAEIREQATALAVYAAIRGTDLQTIERLKDRIAELEYQIERDQGRDELLAELNKAHEDVIALRHALTIPTSAPVPTMTKFEFEVIINDLLCLKERLPS